MEMNEEERQGAFEMVANVQFNHLREDLSELKTRVHGLETALSRGVMLLLANLTGVAVMLAREWLSSIAP